MSRRDLIGAWQRPQASVVRRASAFSEVKGDRVMIVFGADTHKSSHTIAAVGASTGELLGDTTIQVGDGGFERALAWARDVGAERVWAAAMSRAAWSGSWWSAASAWSGSQQG